MNLDAHLFDSASDECPSTARASSITIPKHINRNEHKMSRRFIGQGKNTSFVCANCGRDVPPLANGSYRNHCPFCLYSLHVDINPGDRASDCGGLLEPVAVDYNGKKGWIIVSRCQTCGMEKRNKAALDDSNQPDDFEVILELSRQ
ncbi:MAG: RNHCP domain-containing protein [Deinococcota bacterium]